jgi:starch phosphorylase
MRLHQELVLGVGGVRAPAGARDRPSVWHLNEGHSAFLLAERAREYVATGAELDDALDRGRADSVFTIHTPVSAGNERFSSDLVRRVAGPLLDGDGRPHTGGVPLDRVLELGLGVDGDRGQFDMTAFSLRLTRAANAVSQLHAQTADATWRPIAPHGIGGITNGIHTPSWVGHAMGETLARSVRADLDNLDAEGNGGQFWEHLDQIPTEELWATHQRQKLELAVFARRRLRNQFARHGEAPAVLDALETALDPDVLTIGFAGGSRPTSGRACCSATSTGWPASSGARTGRSRSSTPARPTPPTAPASRSSRRSSAGRCRTSSAAACSSSRTTTSGSPATSWPASTSG